MRESWGRRSGMAELSVFFVKGPGQRVTEGKRDTVTEGEHFCC